jgi:hypothetical protein
MVNVKAITEEVITKWYHNVEHICVDLLSHKAK